VFLLFERIILDASTLLLVINLISLDCLI